MASPKALRRVLADLTEDLARDELEDIMRELLSRKLSKIIDSTNALDEEGLAWLFALAEFHASKSAAPRIAEHVLRPEETTKLVARLKTEAANQRAAKAAAKAEREAAKAQNDG
ncbi:hypothetical protein ROJ8625_03614 [Roseivivax jejudonensis]|uniref:Uncharacterized protein n=1 Tax=Roseivivax jejudonensis TaxID=1529041 RepID=A0A1X7A366_9RHOB|nr:hypothetical protein [Roseivivax jejudonensis]SLN69270.1 hypothetical protein ROJ8625_03614 [Roseivivax jejudonensis]